jgi:plasmid stabilization system protein ParE
MSSFKWSATATGDLQRIAEYIRDTYPAQEHRTISTIINKANFLTQHPRLGQRRETDEMGTELRTLLVSKRYRVLYEVTFADDVEILQVIDLRSDQDYYR